MPDETDELMESFNEKQTQILKKISDYNNSGVWGMPAALIGLKSAFTNLNKVQKQLLESEDPKYRLYALSKMLESAAKNDEVSNFKIDNVTRHPDYPHETLNTSQMAVLTIFTQVKSWEITKKYSEQVFKGMAPEEMTKNQPDIVKIQRQIEKVREIYGPEGMQSLPTGVKLENIQLPGNVLAWGEANGKKWTPGFVASAEGPDQGLDTGSDSSVEAMGEEEQALAEGPGQGVDTNPPSDYRAELLLKCITKMKNGAPMLFSRNKKLSGDFEDLKDYFENKNGGVSDNKAMLDKTRDYMSKIVRNKIRYSGKKSTEKHEETLKNLEKSQNWRDLESSAQTISSGKNSRERHEETLKNLEKSQNWGDLESSAQTISNGQEKVFSGQEIRNLLFGGDESGSDELGNDESGSDESGSDDEEMGLDHEGISYEDATLLWGEGEPDSDDENYEYDAHDRMVEELFDGEQSSETGSSKTHRSSWGGQLREFAKKIGGHKEEAEKGTTRYKEIKNTGGEKFEGGSKSPNNSSGCGG